jgi:hypothetical protein
MQNPPLDYTQPLVDSDGRASLQLQKVINQLFYSQPILGNGSPEGVVEALQFSEYIDKDGSTGQVKYVKTLTDIGGDKSKGWILV